MRQRFAWLLVILAPCVLVGCGAGRGSDMPELGTVQGTVTLDGQPVPNVSIYFKPEVGRMSIAKTDADGEYEAMYLIDEEGVKIGPSTVYLEYAPDDSGPSIPEKYGPKGILKLNVQSGSNTFDIKMSSQ
jgi:hypothetical protein